LGNYLTAEKREEEFTLRKTVTKNKHTILCVNLSADRQAHLTLLSAVNPNEQYATHFTFIKR